MSRSGEIPGGTVEIGLHLLRRDEEDSTDLGGLCAVILTQIEYLCQSEAVGGYIWQRDGFNLHVETLSEVSKPAYSYLQGSIRIGASLVDEAFIVWLLYCISILHSRLAITIRDSDGEPLLIEASDALVSRDLLSEDQGRWRWLRDLSPDNSQGRVWISRGRLYLIPLEHKGKGKTRQRTKEEAWILPDLDEEDPFARRFEPEQGSGGLDLHESLALLAKPEVAQVAPEQVQAAVFARCPDYVSLKGSSEGPPSIDLLLSSEDTTRYPLLAKSHFHRTFALLPVEIIRALNTDPNLLGHAVESFLESDETNLRWARKMEKFVPQPIYRHGHGDSTPSSSSSSGGLEQGSLLSSIKLTKVMYAQLDGRSFYPPKVFGKDWLPVKPDDGSSNEDRLCYLQTALGLKIACGFEIAYQESLQRYQRRQIPNCQVIRPDPSDPRYSRYLRTLVDLGFFGNELQGSKRWRELESEAGKRWMQTNLREDDLAAFRIRVDKALEHAPPLTKDDLPLLLETTGVMDDDSWLYQSMNEVDPAKGAPDAAMDLEHDHDQPEPALLNDITENLSGLAEKMKAFVDRTSGLDGAEFEDEAETDDDPGSDEDEDVDVESDDPEMTELKKEKYKNDFAASLAPQTPWGIQHLVEHGDEDFMSQDLVGPRSGSAVNDSERRRIITELGMKMQEDDGTIEDGDEEPVVVGGQTSIGTVASLPTRPQADTLDQVKANLGKDVQVDLDPYSDSDWEDDDEVNPDFRALADEGLTRDDIERLDKDNMPDFDAEDFLDFTRQALGLDQAQYEDIIRTRRDQGRYVPEKVKSQIPKDFKRPSQSGKTASTSNKAPRAPDGLGTFEEVMAAMDQELSKHEQLRSFSSKNDQGSNAQMDEEDMDYNLVKNMLESFQSQGSNSGPGESLAARLGHRLPREG